MKKEYKLNISPRILELLGQSLYTNIYYVLAELIANAYDADAKNVYIIEEKNYIKVEDDGSGMSYDNNEIEKYLNVAAVSRTSEEDSKTKLGRYKMGRKGVGKLAALSVSENVDVLTISKGDKSGFILSRKLEENKKLQPIDEEDIKFEKIKEHGTAIVMRSPKYKLDENIELVKKNILKIFPLIDKKFRIHVTKGNLSIIIDKFDEGIASELCSILTLGKDFEYLDNLVEKNLSDSIINQPTYIKSNLIEHQEEIKIPLKMKNKNGEKIEYELIIEGWIGAYETSAKRKLTLADFPDNFISLFANKKMGEFNILPSVAKNSLYDVYIVGQLHIELFESSDFPDIALSNRQGYKSDDERYIKVINYVRNTLLPNIIKKRIAFAKYQKGDRKLKKYKANEKKEIKFKKDVDSFQKKTSEQAALEIQKLAPNLKYKEIKIIIETFINRNKEIFGAKLKIDDQKKKILISQTEADKPLADIIYDMLIYNNIPAKDILYNNSDNSDSSIPIEEDIYHYLEKFFVESYSAQKMFVIFVTSENTPYSWGAMLEIGAQWITKANYYIFNIEPFEPKEPLDTRKQWQPVQKNEHDELSIKLRYAATFCERIEKICHELGYNRRDRSENMQELKKHVSII